MASLKQQILHSTKKYNSASLLSNISFRFCSLLILKAQQQPNEKERLDVFNSNHLRTDLKDSTCCVYAEGTVNRLISLKSSE